ncbi:TraR/DksA C4-type zinc finger protein [Methylobrevis pamukkalensis]|uniref:Zinc finger DksA/TraR C4-type domain-containing protein n=1 Tax=Methylobrevis pamukkalensis TaxID=1439726 RepID=A0A1E3H4F1_9HYPH|nr:TraR/DksA C4-type zinc finger protein [Methylobrevis pamukkalensis]ODN71190.1 hypothetical protein A6302_01479 [Methylobrevis pamukkalensis]
MDDVDQAQLREEGERAAALARLMAQAAAPGAAVCDDCGEEIPAMRRQALPSARRCIGCAEWNEAPKRGRDDWKP